MRSIALAMVTCLAFWSGSAEAISTFNPTYTVTYKGTVSSGYDQNGRFIAAGSEFNDETFKLVFSVDTSKGNFVDYNYGPTDRTTGLTGGILGGHTVPGSGGLTPIRAVLTINGHEEEMGSDEFAGDFRSIYGSDSSIFSAVDDAAASGLGTEFDPDYAINANIYVIKPVSINLLKKYYSTGSGTGNFVFFRPEIIDCCNDHGFIYRDNTYGDLSMTSVSVEPTSPVPLPAALPLFGAALGGLGLIGRWRKRRAE